MCFVVVIVIVLTQQGTKWTEASNRMLLLLLPRVSILGISHRLEKEDAIFVSRDVGDVVDLRWFAIQKQPALIESTMLSPKKVCGMG